MTSVALAMLSSLRPILPTSGWLGELTLVDKAIVSLRDTNGEVARGYTCHQRADAAMRSISSFFPTANEATSPAAALLSSEIIP